jgi:PHD/YefM family antitoxin component YafN of YafNO toxin-antitoxin module
MNAVPQIVPVTDLRLKHVQVFGMLHNGPVVLAQRSRPAAVLVSVEAWDKLAAELKRLRRIIEADRHFAQASAGDVVALEDLDQALASA